MSGARSVFLRALASPTEAEAIRVAGTSSLQGGLVSCRNADRPYTETVMTTMIAE